jgi:membrane-bound lytic murein transglycosylase D
MRFPLQSSRVLSSAFLMLAILFPVLATDMLCPEPALAETSSIATTRRNPTFAVPAGLRPRVQFWIDIFTKYGKNHAVIHHREFPQIVFEVLDFRLQAASMTPVQLELWRKKQVAERIRIIQQAFRNLAAGRRPSTPLEQRIVSKMSFLPGGVRKYDQVLKEDLVRSQTGIREKYIEAVQRSGRYMHILEHIFVNEFQLPVELTRLPFVESSFDYKAYSSVGAAGIWQFMPRTAKSFMRVDSLVDERRDVVSATRGAAKYMRQAFRSLQAWPLAVTSYNHGVGGVAKKVREAGTNDITRILENPNRRHFGFASGNFYPEFLAALEVYDQIPRYFPGITLEAPLWIASRKLSHQTSVRYLMQQTGVGIEDLRRMNYAISEPIWRGAYPLPAGYEIKVPRQLAARLQAMPLPDPDARNTVVSSSVVNGGNVYTVRIGDTLGGIAKRHRTSVASIRSLNNLRSDVVRVGQRLVISQSLARSQGGVPVTKSVQPVRPAQTGSVQTYVVQRGDSLSSIAARFHTNVQGLRNLNGLRNSDIVAGQRLRVPAQSTVRTPVRSLSNVNPAPVYYQVRSGDSLWGIARKYGVNALQIQNLNHLKGSTVQVGQKLRVK